MRHLFNRLGRVLGILWASPITLPAVVLTLLFYPSGTRGRLLRYGCATAWVAWGGWLTVILAHLPFGAVSGLTLGHVVWLSDRWMVRPIGAHEFVHVRQYAWLGGLFPVIYGLESLWQWLRGGYYYWDNRFEIAAYRCGREHFIRVGKKSPSSSID